MNISCIWAMSENHVIGRENRLPWHLPADLRRFRSLTMGHAIIMGRKTWESIGRALPGRTSIVLSRDPSYSAPGVLVVRSLDEAFARVAGDEEAFVIGGASVLAAALPRARRAYVTIVHAEAEGDVRLPSDVLRGFRLVAEERHEPDGRNPLPYSFRVYERE